MRTPTKESILLSRLMIPEVECGTSKTMWGFKQYHDGRPRGPLWRGKKLIGKEAIFVVLGLKRFKNDEEKLRKFIKCHVSRLLKMDMIAVLTELERQEEVSLAVMVCLHSRSYAVCPFSYSLIDFVWSFQNLLYQFLKWLLVWPLSVLVL